MNLTSKRMLQFVAGLAGVCALSASAATTWVEDSFEAPDGSLDLLIGQYKLIDNLDLTFTTNWFAAEGDASKLVATVGSYVGTRPMTNAPATDLVLNLETEGQTLTRKVTDTPYNFVTGDPVYVDTLIKFTPSEDDPVIDDSAVKAAVFVNVSSNLVVYHGTETPSVTASDDVGFAINPEQWYRLTIMLGSNPGLSFPGFKVYIDGTAISSAVGYDDNGNQPGEWFINASVENTLSAVAFQGTGMVDELVVADSANGFGGAAAILLTLAFDNTVMAVTLGGNPVASNDTVEVGSTIAIDANDWYEIVSVSGSGVVYTGATGEQVNTSTGDLTMGAPAETTVTITAQQYTGSFNTGSGTVDASKVSAWAIANNKSEADVTANAASWMDDYLMNVAPDTNAKLMIASITMVAGDAQIVITTDKPGIVDNLEGINGTLKYYTAGDLATPFQPKGTISVTGAGTSVTVTVPYLDGNFIKAVLE